ncbi:hypothetical protein A4G99_06005 [Haladaptatus sp. R4]|uniref:ArsR/SmtB family transcription factor n=1 Tax=Haladaptatus sp. R4 TaxID=1679489 RepID=UPI0007B49DB9|nr:winged helix-turn-helix domain-containing protein [Haladaptatus sp. R4]KZN24024.1 hypothetical protein A4G99_06005 [Haladaptatus sp. R4]
MGSPEDATDPAAAFSTLSDSTRVEIVRELSNAQRESPGDPALPFAELRKGVGVRDSGRFLYHLKKLRGHFIEKTEEGYRLNYAGIEMAASILAGTYTERETLGPVELDSTCIDCDETAVGRYENGILSVACENDHLLFQWGLPPNAAADATVGKLVELATTLVFHAVELSLVGTCPKCYDPMTTAVEPVEPERLAPRFRANCGTCGCLIIGPVGFCLLGQSDVDAFYHRHGRSVRSSYLWELEFAGNDASLVSEGNNGRYVLSFRLDDEELSATVDDTAHVVETTRRTVG